MQFDRMRPHEIAAAVAAGVPVVLPIGVMEYHGEHLPAGVDLLIVTETLKRLGLPTKLRRIPLPVALVAASAMEAVASVTGREPTLTRYSAAILARTQTYDISGAKRDLGYKPIVSFAEGMDRTLNSLR